MKWRALCFLSAAELLGMSLWFSASAVVPALSAEWGLSDGSKAWLTMSVQIGFVVGTLLSALFNLSDVMNARQLFAASAFLGAGFNAGIGLFAEGLGAALPLRFLTGVCLAGVYPPGMKIAASWFKEGRGMAIGALVGALTVGSASPHLLKAFGGPNWRPTMLVASASAAIGAIICLAFVKDGPHQAKPPKFNWRFIGSALRDQGARLANFGYLGHMWELYAVWTWLPLFLLASFTASGVESAQMWSAMGGFAVIAVGGVGSVIAGLLADRFGRTTITIISLSISGSCCLLAGAFFGGNPTPLIALCLVWGLVIVADSAQFSAAVTELASPEYVGTSLTLQTGMGFLLTLASIRLIPIFVDWVGWRWAFAFLAVGPAFGIVSMAQLRALPVAAKIEGERKA